MSGRTNPNFISTLSTSPSSRIIDGTDNIHSAIIDTLNIASGGNRVVRGFDITLGNSGTYTSYTLGSNNFILRDGILTQVADNASVSQTVTMNSSSNTTYAVLVVAANNSLAIRNHTTANKVADLVADDIPIAVVEIAAGSAANAVDRKVQFLGYEQTNQGLSIIDNNTETLKINKEGTVTKGGGTITFPSSTGTLALTSQLPTDASVRQHVSDATNSNVFTDAEKTKLTNIEASANAFTLPTAAANTLGGIKVGTNLTINGSGVLSATNDNTQLSTEQVQDIVGAMFSSNTETGISATYVDDDGTIDLVVTTANDDVSVDNLETRLAQINTATTIGNGVAITTGGNLTVTGDLTVSGSTTTLDVTNLAIEDNTILLNKNQTGNSTTDAGIEVERGNYSNVQLKWNETSNRWTFTNDGSNYFNIPITSELANPYVHPTYSTTNINTSGAVIVDSITTNNTGHITAMGTRTLTLADLGYTGTANANTYVHPNHSGDVTSNADGATTITNNAVTTAKIADSSVTSAKIASNAITNAKVDSNAEIAQSKISGLVSALSGKEPSLTISDGLDRTGATLKLDITGLTNENGIDRTADFVAFHDNSVGLRKVNLANIFAKLTANDIPNLDGSYRAVGTQIVNADISNSAAISADKIAAGTSNKLFTSALETKLAGIEAGAEVNVNADWNSGSGDSQILNKPTIPSGNQIIDWTANGAGTIHASNYVNTTYSVGDGGLTQKNFTTALHDKLVGVAANANNFSLTSGSVTNAHLAGSIANSKLDDIAQSKVTGLVTALNTKVENLGDLSITASASEINILDGVTNVSSTEIGYLDGVTSSIQTQLDSKLSSLALAGLTDVSSFDSSITSGASGSGIPSTLAVKTYVDGKATVDTTYSLITEDGLDGNGDNDPAVKTIRLRDNTSGSGSVFHLAMGAGLSISRNAGSDTLTLTNTGSTLSKSTLTPILASYDSTDTLNIGDTDNDTTVNIRGNLNVLGTTTTVNQTQVNVQNAFVFEGATADSHETTLTITDPTDDRTITLPDITGTLITSADTGTVTNGMLASTSVSSAKIASNAVLTSKINASAVTTAKIANSAVTADKLAGSSVTTAKLNDGSVTVDKIDGLSSFGSGTVISSAERTKLSGIEASADVTDATNVAAAGAVMDGDFSSNGFMKRTGAGSYTVDTNTYLTSLAVTGLSDINAFDTDLSSVSASHDSLASAKAIKTYVDANAGGSFTSFNIKDGVGTTVNVTDGKHVQFTQGTGITATWTDTNSGASSDPFDITLTNTGVTSNVAGTGIGVSGATGAVTITNTDLGSSQNIFKTIAVSGQDNIVADSNNDTLTFVGGTNVTITTTAGSDTLTINAADTNTQISQEQVEDYVGGLITAGSNITVQYNDGAGQLSIAGTANDDVSVPNLKTALNSDFGGDFTIGNQSDDTLTVSGSLTVGADLIVSGDTVTVNTSTLTVEDPLISLGKNNDADTVDLGFYGKYNDGSNIRYSGLFRDASDSDKWKLFSSTGNSNAEPTSTVNTTSGFTLGTLVASSFEGGLVGNATTATTLATARTIAGVSFDGSADIALPLNNLTGTLAVSRGGTGLTSIASLLNSNVSLAVADLSDIASLDTDISSVSSNDDTLASAKAIKTYVDAQFAGAGSGDMTGVDITAGDAITVSQSNTTSGDYTATISVSGLGVAQLAGSALQTSSESFNNNDTSLMTSAAIEDKILSYGYGTGSGDGDITAVYAGVGLSGGATTGDATLNLDFSELTDKTDDIAGTTEFIIQDGTTESRKAASEIKLSYFNNDANWNNYVHPTGAGNNHIPSGGSAGQFLKYSSSGTAVWATPSYTTEEQVEDFIAAMITEGSNITKTYDDAAGTLTIAATNTNTQLSNEQVQDIVGGMVSSNTETNIAVTYDDTNGKLNFVSTQLSLLDEDDFASDSATAAASQQSIKAYVATQVSNLVDSAPSALDTLNELAAALGDDASFSTTTATALGNRLRVDTNSQGLTSTQKGNALDNLGITASLAEINILASGLSAGDIPNLNASKINDGVFDAARIPTLNQNTTGSAGSLSATLAIASGGTGATSASGARTALGLGAAAVKAVASDDSNGIADGESGLVTGNAVYDYIAAQGFGTATGDITAVTFQTDSGSGAKATDTGGSADFILQGSTGIDVTNNLTTMTVALDLAELADGADDVVGSADELIYLDDGNQKRKLISEIKLGQFNNDQNWNNYTHPTHNGDDIDIDTTALTGATVISDLDLNITTDTLGHVTDANATIATRNLTLANLGFTGDADATDDQTAAEITALLNDVASYTLGDNSGTITVGNHLTVTGDLLVSGNTVTLNTATLDVEDLNITVGKGATTSSATNGAGLTFGAWSSGTVPTLTWVHADSRLSVNKTLHSSGGFVGALTGDVTGNVTGSSGSTTGNAATATALAGNANANVVYAGPTTGSASAPAFRALVAADIPDLSGTYSTSDTVDMGDGFIVVGDSNSNATTIVEGETLTIAGGTSISTDTSADGTLTITNDAPHVATNLGKTTATGQITITSSTGNNVVIGEATGSIAGLMSTTHHDKLDNIEAGATADQTAAEITALLDDVASYTLGTAGSGTITIANDLVVTGTTTTNNVETVSTSNGVVFESNATGSHVDKETLLTGVTGLTSDITVTLPSTTGTLALTSSNITGNASTATTATHIAGGALGSIPYQSDSATTALLAGNTTTTKKFLTQTGNGSASAVPSWGTLVAGDIPSLNASKIGSGTLPVNRGGTGTTSSNSWLNSRITTNADGSLNYDATSPTAVNHDSLAGFVAAEHYRWDTDISGTATIHANNIPTLNQNTTGNADTATLATSITVSANNSTDETVYPVFVDGATGTQGAETDTGLSYNPNTGILSSSGFTGDLTGDVTGTARGLTSVSNGSITISPNGTGKTNFRGSNVTRVHSDTGDTTGNAAQQLGITKVTGSSNPLSANVSTGSAFSVPFILPNGTVNSGTSGYRAIKGTIHIDAGLSSDNFVMTQDFIANDRYGNAQFDFISYGVVHEGTSDMPFEVSWNEASGDDMTLSIKNVTGADVTNAIKVYWDLTLFPKA